MTKVVIEIEDDEERDNVHVSMKFDTESGKGLWSPAISYGARVLDLISGLDDTLVHSDISFHRD